MAPDPEGNVAVATSTTAPTEAPRRRNRRALVEWVVIVVVALVVALLIRTFAIQPFSIPSGSMEPTLRVHDRVLVNKLSYHLHAVHRGDIVVFKKPPAFSDPGVTDLIKRVIGLPGETISLANGQIYVDGRLLDQKWLPAEGIRHPGPAITNLGCANAGHPVDYCVIPRGDYYVMGDNRDNSDDSRFFGPIPGNLIIGKAFMIFWPLDHIRTL